MVLSHDILQQPVSCVLFL